jgi:hypothetical protein
VTICAEADTASPILTASMLPVGERGIAMHESRKVRRIDIDRRHV